MDELHRRLLHIGFAAGDDLGLVLAGGYALAAHELVHRPSRDIDFATATALPLPVVAARLVDAYVIAGFAARVIETSPRMARLVVSADSVTCEVDLLKVHDRAAHRDYIDVRAANSRLGWHELESLGR